MPIYLPIRRPLYTKPQLGTPINSGHPLVYGLAAGWLFNEGAGLNVFDLLQTCNGTYSGTQKPYWQSGFSGTSGYFNGTGSISVGSKSSLNLSGAMTISAWVNYFSGAGFVTVISDAAGGGGPGEFLLFIAQSTGVMTWKQNTSSATNSSNTGPKLSAGQWFHVAAVRPSGSASETISFYVNGRLNGTGAVTQVPGAQAGAFLGSNSPTGGNLFKGKIDNILVWNYALTTDQIMRLYVDPYCFMKQPRQGILKQNQSIVSVTGNAIWFGAIA